MSLLVGLTGSMGSGKTLVASLFGELGAHVIDADAVCRALVRPHQPAWKEIVGTFGESVLLEDQTLNRSRLAEIVFADHRQKEILEGILHPRVFEEEQRIYDEIREQEPDALVIIDAALLIESGNYKKVDKVIVVRCDEDEQIRRVVSSGSFTREEVLKRIRSQMALEEKVKVADYILDNNGGMEDLKRQVQELYCELKKSAG